MRRKVLHTGEILDHPNRPYMVLIAPGMGLLEAKTSKDLDDADQHPDFAFDPELLRLAKETGCLAYRDPHVEGTVHVVFDEQFAMQTDTLSNRHLILDVVQNIWPGHRVIFTIHGI